MDVVVFVHWESVIGNSIAGGELMTDSATTYVANTRLIDTATDAKTVATVRVGMGGSSDYLSIIIHQGGVVWKYVPVRKLSP